MEDSTNPTTGTASAVATRPLNRIPNFMNSPRREISSSTIVKLLVVREIRNRIWLAGVLGTPGNEPGNYVGDFLLRHRLALHVAAPVWRAKLGTARDDNGAQTLIADKREKRIIRDGAALLCAMPGCSMAGFAIRFVSGFALLSIAGGFRGVGRRIGRVESSGLAPARSDSARNHFNLLVRHQSARALGKSRHRGSAQAVGDIFANGGVIHDRQINRIGQPDGGASMSFRAVATCAVFGIQCGEVGNFAGRNGFRTYFRLSRSGIATRKKDRAERRECADVAEWFHGRFSPSPRVGIVPGASTPARMRNGMFSRVRTRS